MIKVKVDGKDRIVRDSMIHYHTENDLECTYKNHHINIAKQEVGDFYVTVRDQTGMLVVQGGFGDYYCIETIEDCLVMCMQNIL